MHLNRKLCSLAIMASLFVVGCSGMVLSGLEEKNQDYYNGQTAGAIASAAKLSTVEGAQLQAGKVLIMPVYLSAKYSDSTPGGYEDWWGARPTSGGWIMKNIASEVWNGLVADLKKRNFDFVASKILKEDAAIAKMGEKSAPDAEFQFPLANLGAGVGPYGYTSFGESYFSPRHGQAIAQAANADVVVFPKIQVFFGNAMEGLSQMNKEIIINRAMVYATEIIVCTRNSDKCTKVVMSGRAPAQMTVPVPNLREITAKENRVANSEFAEKLVHTRLTKVLLGQFERVVKK